MWLFVCVLFNNCHGDLQVCVLFLMDGGWLREWMEGEEGWGKGRGGEERWKVGERKKGDLCVCVLEGIVLSLLFSFFFFF